MQYKRDNAQEKWLDVHHVYKEYIVEGCSDIYQRELGTIFGRTRAEAVSKLNNLDAETEAKMIAAPFNGSNRGRHTCIRVHEWGEKDGWFFEYRRDNADQIWENEKRFPVMGCGRGRELGTISGPDMKRAVAKLNDSNYLSSTLSVTYTFWGVHKCILVGTHSVKWTRDNAQEPWRKEEDRDLAELPQADAKPMTDAFLPPRRI